MRAALGLVLGLVARVWLFSLFVRVIWSASLQKKEATPWVLCFWHGTQFPMLAAPRRRRAVAMVSRSRDGQMQSVSLAVQGFRTVRGSSSLGGAAAQRALTRVLKSEPLDAVFAVDGPRGPYGKVKMGAISAARIASARLVPVGAAMASGHIFARAWDRFLLPWPLTRVVVVVGDPIDPHDIDVQSKLESAIAECNRRATCELQEATRSMRQVAS